MSHDLDFSTGAAAIAYAGGAPWHGLGEKLPEGQPIESWLKAARLEWDLKRLPVQYFVDGKLRTMDDRFALVRSDTGTALSIVSSDYQVVQPKEILEFYSDLMNDYGYTLETAGALDGGRKVWALARTGKTDTVDDEGLDELAAYVLLATSCDKTLATTAAFTSVRVVCQNTLFFALNDAKVEKRPQVKVTHNHHFNPRQVKIDLGIIDPAWDAFISQVHEMVKRPVEDEEARAFFQDLLKPGGDRPLSPRAQREASTIMALYHDSPGQKLPTAKDTLWGVVNAVTYYADHGRKGNVEERLDSAWFGAASALKDKAWAAATRLLALSR